MAELKDIHIGKLIAERLKASGLSHAEFARRINVERTTVYNILRNKSIDIERLLLISEVLEYNFIENVYFASNQKQESNSLKIVIPRQKLGEMSQSAIETIEILITPAKP